MSGALSCTAWASVLGEWTMLAYVCVHVYFTSYSYLFIALKGTTCSFLLVPGLFPLTTLGFWKNSRFLSFVAVEPFKHPLADSRYMTVSKTFEANLVTAVVLSQEYQIFQTIISVFFISTCTGSGRKFFVFPFHSCKCRRWFVDYFSTCVIRRSFHLRLSHFFIMPRSFV